MIDYIKSLELRNEELQQELAKALTKNLELNFYKDGLVFNWSKIIVPTNSSSQNCIKSSCIYVYKNSFFVFAEIYYDEENDGYRISYKLLLEENAAYKHIAFAQRIVVERCEKYYNNMRKQLGFT